MPWRFYRYMLLDVLRQFAITAVILVIVIAFGAVIKPLSSDSLLTVGDTIKYLLLAFIPVLQYAIPFAGAFAVTICLHRMAQDNEFVAMSVSGQSYVRLFAPILAFGALLTIIVAILTQTLIPTFVGKMAQTMAEDLPRLLANSIKQNIPFDRDGLVIWAEDISLDSRNNDERMNLNHVAVASLDDDSRASMYLTASSAFVDVQRVDNQTSLFVGTKNTTQWIKNEDGSSSLRGARDSHLAQAIELPSLAKQRLSALTRSELNYLRDHPVEYEPVQKAIASLTKSINNHIFLKAADNRLKSKGELICVASAGERKFVIKSKGLRRTGFVAPISVTLVSGTGNDSMLSPKNAKLEFHHSSTGEIEFVTLQLNNVTIDVGKRGESQQVEKNIHLLQVNGIPFSQIDDDLSVQQLIAVADEFESQKITNGVSNLLVHLAALDNHVAGRISQRWAVSLLPMLAILLSGLFAIRYANVTPLAVYAKVFAPTVIVMLMIFSGGHMIRDPDVTELTGFSVMWVGVVFLLGLIIFHWSRLRVT